MLHKRLPESAGSRGMGQRVLYLERQGIPAPVFGEGERSDPPGQGHSSRLFEYRQLDAMQSKQNYEGFVLTDPHT